MFKNFGRWHEKKKIYFYRFILFCSFFGTSLLLIALSKRKETPIIWDKIFRFFNPDIKYSKFRIAGDLSAAILLILILSLIMGVYFYLFEKKFLDSCRDMAATSAIIVLSLLLIKFLLPIPTYAVPAFVGVILISLLVDVRVSIIFNMVLSIVTLLIVGTDNLSFALHLFVTGSLCAIVSHSIHNRLQFLSHGFLASLISSLFVLSTELVFKINGAEVLTTLANSFIGTALSFIIAYGTLPVWEYLFDFTTPIRLMELSNPNHPLLKKLLLEAPGTYHHSLIVGNLAEIACEAVGGNYLLARIGAYYHDIGKLKRPFYFKENQILEEDPHNRITPTLSALIIISHTKDGVEIGKEYRLPRQVLDIIKQHHGTTKVAFFYGKALSQNQQVSEEKFRYDGPIPQSKEAAIVMLADSVEAAVRALSSPTPQLIEASIRNVIQEKLLDGQLNNSDLTFRELEVISESFIKVLTGVFHKRVSYNIYEDSSNKADEVIVRSENIHSKSAG
ncbi:HD family phosphohydrolase [Anaerocellum danielii]|uniref:HDIG domain-containing protein n=1 Tax=Anaerocellum danielii TaxID=1387557 RepID=A0ABZ0U2M6_9FIRM|nr:HDIG domain-containing metalloprotein [Caldicellulosiruptor danielii]WPX09972.1 HDIG domain-containing protein [Caldicellulosiruptor danielii]